MFSSEETILIINFAINNTNLILFKAANADIYYALFKKKISKCLADVW